MNDSERQHAGALMLWFIVVHNAGNGANGWARVGATNVRGIGVIASAVAICSGGIEGAGGIDDAGGVVRSAVAVTAIGGIGVKDAVAIAAATFDGGVGIGSAGIVDNAGVGEGGNDKGDDDDGKDDGDSVRGAVGAAAISGCVGIDDADTVRDPIAIAIVGMQVWWGASDVGGFGLNVVSVKGVRQMLKRGRMLRCIDVCQVTMKNGGKVVGWAQ